MKTLQYKSQILEIPAKVPWSKHLVLQNGHPTPKINSLLWVCLNIEYSTVSYSFHWFIIIFLIRLASLQLDSLFSGTSKVDMVLNDFSPLNSPKSSLLHAHKPIFFERHFSSSRIFSCDPFLDSAGVENGTLPTPHL